MTSNVELYTVDLLEFVHLPSSENSAGVLAAAAMATASNFPDIDLNVTASENDEIPRINGDDIAVHYDQPNVTVGDDLTGVVKFGSEWNDFWFQPNTLNDLLVDIEFSLEAIYGASGNDNGEIPSINDRRLSPVLSVGFPCVARYGENNKWFRARVQDLDYQLVHFVDYGNSVICNFDNVKPLSRTLAELCPPLALHCKLADFHNALLPSFVTPHEDQIRITVHSKREPFDVSVQVLSQRSIIPGRPPVSVSADGHDVGGRRRGPSTLTHRETRDGLTLPPLASASATSAKYAQFDDDFEEDIDRAKKNNNSGSRRQGKMSVGRGRVVVISGVPGSVAQLYATCGQVTPDGMYQRSIMDFNSQETTLNNGSLNVEDLSRIFRLQDKLICYGRFEDALPSNTKASLQGGGAFQMTNMEMILNSSYLISHAIVNLVNNSGAQLFIRATNSFVYAPASAFPASIVEKFEGRVEIGRSVLVRAIPSDKFVELDINTEWIAVSVELLGPVAEHQGWMYFVREKYSVILTDGGIGFGYVFVDNNFVNSADVKMEDWYGCRVLFRACMDIPDLDGCSRFGIRWRGLKATLLPEHPKGAYRYPGIYRPPPVVLGGDGPTSAPANGKKSFDDNRDEELDLPDEVVNEMAVMGKDVIGINRPKEMSDVVRTAGINVVAQNLLNESENIPEHLLYRPIGEERPSRTNLAPSDGRGDASIHVEKISEEVEIVEESHVEIVSVDNHVHDDIDLLMGFVNPTAAAQTASIDNRNQPNATSSGVTACSSHVADLFGLLVDVSPAVSCVQTVEANHSNVAEPVESNSATTLFTPVVEDGSSSAVAIATDGLTSDAGIQVELRMQLLEEIRRLKTSPDLFATVFTAFLDAPVETKNFFVNLLKEL